MQLRLLMYCSRSCRLGQASRRGAGIVGVVQGCFMDRVAVAVYSCRRHLFQHSDAAAVAADDNGDEK